MILLFAYKRRAYLSVGLSSEEFPNKVQFVMSSRIPVSNRRKLVAAIKRQLAVERPRPDTPFRMSGGVDLQDFDKFWPIDPHHNGFAILRTEEGFAFRGTKRLC
jgi:hypothetical protein